MSTKIPKKNIAEVYQHNKQRQVNLLHKKPWAPSIKYSMFEADYGTTDYQIIPQESSDSESIVYSPSLYPSLQKVTLQILLNSQYQSIPCSTVLKDGLKSKLIVKNIENNIDMGKVQDFVDKLPIKGFVTEMRLIFYQSYPCILFQLKTDQPLIVANQFLSKQHLKQAKSVFGYDFTCSQLAQLKDGFAAIIIRGLEMSIGASQIDKIISYTLKMKEKECIKESSKQILEVDEVGCMAVVMTDLEYCERIVVAFNGSNLNGLQKNKILVNVHPESVKSRKIDLTQSIQKGVLLEQKLLKGNDKDIN